MGLSTGFRDDRFANYGAPPKCNPAGRGQTQMSEPVRLSLTVPEVYLIVLSLLLIYHVRASAGIAVNK